MTPLYRTVRYMRSEVYLRPYTARYRCVYIKFLWARKANDTYMLVPEKYTFIFVALNLLILFFFMKKFLFKPVTEFMENRKNSIEQALKDADQAKLEAAESRKNYEEQIKKIREESDKLLNEARIKATREYDEIIVNAKKDALVIVEKGRQDVERERAEMLRQVRQQIAALAITAATKVVQANMDTESNKSMVDKFIDEAGAA